MCDHIPGYDCLHTYIIFGFPSNNVYLIHFKQEHTVDYKERTFFTSLDFSKLIALHIFDWK